MLVNTDFIVRTKREQVLDKIMPSFGGSIFCRKVSKTSFKSDNDFLYEAMEKPFERLMY